MIDDGTGYEHDLTKRQHYDQLWAALTGAGLKMVGEHEFPGGRYRILGSGDQELGWVSLTTTQKPEFVSGYWFGLHIVAGRTRNRQQSLADFIDEVHTTHPGRVR
jgi:hypothetical protein